MDQISDGKFVRSSLLSVAIIGYCGGGISMIGLYSALRGNAVGWTELSLVPLFVACIVIIYRRAAKRFP
jgi:hypothetical protein